jgi:hypothetical protein
MQREFVENLAYIERIYGEADISREILGESLCTVCTVERICGKA